MSQIRSRDTEPERLVRQIIYRAGFRFRLHRRDLPGKPDIVLPKYRIAIFVHGCFWHQHRGCIDCSRPKTNREYWESKLAVNIERDRKNRRKLRRLGWKPIVVWECDARAGLATNFLKKLKSQIDSSSDF